MELEQIISAAVEKQLNELFSQTFADKGWESCVQQFRLKVQKEFDKQFKLRAKEVKTKVAKAVASCKVENYEISTYIKIKESKI